MKQKVKELVLQIPTTKQTPIWEGPLNFFEIVATLNLEKEEKGSFVRRPGTKQGKAKVSIAGAKRPGFF